MGIANVIRDITSFARLQLVNKAVQSQNGLMRDKRPLGEMTGAEIVHSNIASCRSLVAKSAVTNFMSAKSVLELAGSFLDATKDKLENMLSLAELAQNPDLTETDRVQYSTQFGAVAAEVTATITGGSGFKINGTAVWGAAYPVTVPVNGSNITFNLTHLDTANAGNLAMDTGAAGGGGVAFVFGDTAPGTRVASATTANAGIAAGLVKGYLGIVATQEAGIVRALSLVDSYIGNLEQVVGQNSAIVDEKSGYDSQRAADMMAELLARAEAAGFGAMLAATLRDIDTRIAMRLLG